MLAAYVDEEDSPQELEAVLALPSDIQLKHIISFILQAAIYIYTKQSAVIILRGISLILSWPIHLD